MGKNLIAISEITYAKKAKYVTPSMMVVEGEMELCMLQNSQNPKPEVTPGGQGGGLDNDDLVNSANYRFTYDF